MTAAPPDLEPLLVGEHPPQRAFSYARDRWQTWTGHLDGVQEVLAGLPPALDRQTTAATVEALVPANVAGAFTVAMIWGHGASGYGPYRTARVLTGSAAPAGAPLSGDVGLRLADSAEVARRDGAVEGYRFLNNRPGRITGLGPAFFTKWLYFVTARGQTTMAAAAPVLDALVLTWLGSRGVTLRPGYTDDYARYVDLLGSWGEPHGLPPAAVEERIFRLIRDDGA
jgi:hypothetical protein